MQVGRTVSCDSVSLTSFDFCAALSSDILMTCSCIDRHTPLLPCIRWGCISYQTIDTMDHYI